MHDFELDTIQGLNPTDAIANNQDKFVRKLKAFCYWVYWLWFRTLESARGALSNQSPYRRHLEWLRLSLRIRCQVELV